MHEDESAGDGSTRELRDGWEFLKSPLAGPLEVWREYGKNAADALLWDTVTLPHCATARDAVDPERRYYQGEMWYRYILEDSLPPGDPVLLRFEGVGQEAEVYVGPELVARHVGGYDEFTVDISGALSRIESQRNVFPRFSDGQIPIAVRVSNRRELDAVPSDLSDFVRHAGIYRPVYLESLPAVSVERLHAHVEMIDSGRAAVSVSARFHTARTLRQAQLSLNVDVKGPDGESVGLIDRTGDDTVSIPNDPAERLLRADGDCGDGAPAVRADPIDGEQGLVAGSEWVDIGRIEIASPQKWSPDKPALYTAQMQITACNGTRIGEEAPAVGSEAFSSQGGMRGRIRFGIVESGFDPELGYQVNGSPILLRGTHRHEDYVDGGAAGDRRTVRRELELMKEMGVNFIRLGHHQQWSYCLDLCDELGILVWEEVPWCRGEAGSSRRGERAERALARMIDQHFNHPSVVFWGLGNEQDWRGDFPDSSEEDTRALMSRLQAYAKRRDPKRSTVIRRCDFARDIPDVYSPSIWAGWYRGTYDEYENSVREACQRSRYVIHAEWGGDSHFARFSETPYAAIGGVPRGMGTDERAGDFAMAGGVPRVARDGDWSESYICDLFDWHLSRMAALRQELPGYAGAAQWIFRDFATPLRPHNPIPYMNQKGLATRDLRPKEGYYVFQSHWAERPMVRIFGHSWIERRTDDQGWIEIRVYSNCPQVELFVDGRSAGSRERNREDVPAAGLRFTVQLEEGTHLLRARGFAPDGEAVDDELSIVTRPYRSEHERSIARELVGPTAQVSGAQANGLWLDLKIEDAKLGETSEAGGAGPQSLDGDNSGRGGPDFFASARLCYPGGDTCLDDRRFVRFRAAANIDLIDNLGTPDGSRIVALACGRARIGLRVREWSAATGSSSESPAAGVVSVEASGGLSSWAVVEP